MYAKSLSTLFLLFISLISFGQKDSHFKQLVKIRHNCETIMGSFSGKPETIEALIKEGNTGLKLTKETDQEFKFSFYMAIGSGYYYKQDFKSAKDNFEKAYTSAVNAGILEKSLRPLGNLVFVYHYLGMQSEADVAAQKLKNAVETIDTLKNKTDIYYNLGIYNQQQKFYYSIALENFLKSVELHKPILDTTKILKKKLDYASKLMMVAEIYIQLKQPKKALEYLNEAKPHINLSLLVDISAYGKFIRAYVLLNDKKQALKYYNLLHKAAGENASRWSELVSSNLEIAFLYAKEKDYKTAKVYLEKADKQSKLDNKEILTSSVNLAYGDFYKNQQDYLKASKYYKLAEKGSKIYNKEQYSELLKALTEVEIKSGNAKEASITFNKYLSVSDSLNQRKVALNLAEMEAKFQNKFKQQKIGELNKENEDKDVQLYEEKRTRWFLIGGAFLLLIALFSIYLNVRNKKKANLLLDKKNQQLDIVNAQLNNANQTKTKLFSIISHDLRSPVSQLFTFLRMQQINPNQISEEQKAVHQKKLMSSATNLLATMEDLLLWSKSQLEHFELNMEVINLQYLFEEAIELMQNQADDKGILIKVANLKVGEVQSDQNLLMIVMRNLLQNAINHSFINTSILLNTGSEDGKSFISILNQGEVISEDKIEELLSNQNVKSKSSGYGLVIVKELLEKLNGTLQISSNADGTTMKVSFS